MTRNYNENFVLADKFQINIKTVSTNFSPIQDLVLVRQVHGDLVVVIDENCISDLEGDSIITNSNTTSLGVRVADCAAIILVDPVTKAFGVIHSGWRGTKLNIVGKTVNKMVDTFNLNPKNIKAWLSPMVCGKCYQVGPEFNDYFNPKYLKKNRANLTFDNRQAVVDQLTAADILEENLIVDQRCTIEDSTLPSHRRNGTKDRLLISVKRLN